MPSPSQAYHSWTDASGVPTDGLAGWTVWLMDRLGLFGATLVVSLDNFLPPIPSKIILPLAGFRGQPGHVLAQAV